MSSIHQHKYINTYTGSDGKFCYVYFSTIKKNNLRLGARASSVFLSSLFISISLSHRGSGYPLYLLFLKFSVICKHKIYHLSHFKVYTHFCFTVLEIISLKSGCWQGWVLLGPLRENLFHASLLAFSGCWQSPMLPALWEHNSNFFFWLHMVVFPVCTSPFSPLIRSLDSVTSF